METDLEIEYVNNVKKNVAHQCELQVKNMFRKVQMGRKENVRHDSLQNKN